MEQAGWDRRAERGRPRGLDLLASYRVRSLPQWRYHTSRFPIQYHTRPGIGTVVGYGDGGRPLPGPLTHFELDRDGTIIQRAGFGNWCPISATRLWWLQHATILDSLRDDFTATPNDP